jgi:hypothetical protein
MRDGGGVYGLDPTDAPLLLRNHRKRRYLRSHFGPEMSEQFIEIATYAGGTAATLVGTVLLGLMRCRRKPWSANEVSFSVIAHVPKVEVAQTQFHGNALGAEAPRADNPPEI